MSIENLHSEYPTDAQIEEMWAAYKSSGREGILAFLRKRTLEWRNAEHQTMPRLTEDLTGADH